MESNSQAMQIHISQTTKQRLGHMYRTVERGGIHVKGKGAMKTYWLRSKDGRRPVSHKIPPLDQGTPPQPLEPRLSLGGTRYTPVSQDYQKQQRPASGSQGSQHQHQHQHQRPASATSDGTQSGAVVKMSNLLTFDESRVIDIKRQRSRVVPPGRTSRAHSISSASFAEVVRAPPTLPSLARLSMNDLSHSPVGSVPIPAAPPLLVQAAHANLDSAPGKPSCHYSKSVEAVVVSTPSGCCRPQAAKGSSAVCRLV